MPRFSPRFAIPLVPDAAFTTGQRKKFDAMAGDTARALLAWNGGGNPSYAAQVLARLPHYL